MIDFSDIIFGQRLVNLDLGHDFSVMSERERVNYIRDTVLAATEELHEVLRETTWKPWTREPAKVNNAAALEELIDALLFVVNLALAVSPHLSSDQLSAEILRLATTKQNAFPERYSQPNPKTSPDLAYELDRYCPGCGVELHKSSVVVDRQAGSVYLNNSDRVRLEPPIFGMTCAKCHVPLSAKLSTPKGKEPTT